jgi:hypothetical protein
MNIWILTWVLVSSTDSVSSGSQEYSTPKACLEAKQVQTKLFNTRFYTDYKAVCTAKIL